MLSGAAAGKRNFLLLAITLPFACPWLADPSGDADSNSDAFLVVAATREVHFCQANRLPSKAHSAVIRGESRNLEEGMETRFRTGPPRSSAASLFGHFLQLM